MPRTRTGTRRTGSRKKTQAAIRRAALIDVAPKRGVKLKHFSSFIMLVALLCLFAYLAGRVDVSAATSAPAQERGAQSASKAVTEAKEWYSKVFGVQPYFDEPAYYVGYNIGGYELGLTPAPKAAAKRDAAGGAYWGGEEIRAPYKRLLDLGATSVSDVQAVGGGILVADVADQICN